MSRKLGKVIDQITYRGPGLSDISVPLRMATIAGQYVYLVSSEDPKIFDKDSDPNALKARVLEKLKASHSIKWQDVILIKAERGEMSIARSWRHNYGRQSTPVTLSMGLSCELMAMRVGLGRATGGDAVWRESEPLQEDRPYLDRHSKDVNCGTPEGITYDRVTGLFSPDEENGYAVLDDTEENQQKVRQLLASFDILGKHLGLLLGQDRIVATLGNMKVLALPAPDSAPGITPRTTP